MLQPRTGLVALPDEQEWTVWDDDRGRLRWCLMVDEAGSGTVGMMTLDDGGWLAPHRHHPAELYLVHSGEAAVLLDGAEFHVGPGAVVHIPGDAEHAVRAAGTGPVRIMFVFPTTAFDDVVYRFHHDGEPGRREVAGGL